MLVRRYADLVGNASTAAANIGRMSTEIEGLAKDLRGEFSNMEGKHGEKISGLLTEATLAAQQITSMSKEFEGLAKDLRTDAGPLAGGAGSRPRFDMWSAPRVLGLGKL